MAGINEDSEGVPKEETSEGLRDIFALISTIFLLNSLIEEIGDIPGAISVVFLLTSALQPLVRKRQEELSAKLTKVLLEEHQLALHCKAVRSVLLMEAGDTMHEFYSHLFSKVSA